MGLLQTLGLRKKNRGEKKSLLDTLASYDRLIKGYEILVDLQQLMLSGKDKTEEAMDVATDLVDVVTDMAGTAVKAVKPKAKRTRPRKKGKHLFASADAAAALTDWFNRRSNKWLTKSQVQTMTTSPLKGIPDSSFYRVLEIAGIETDKAARPHQYRLKKAIPDAPKLYGVSLTTINQQLKGTQTKITLHSTDCFWHKRKGGEWLYADNLPELRAKIKKLFDTYGDGRVAEIKRCSSCARAGRLPTVTSVTKRSHRHLSN
jgi:hypothetical protein